MELVINFFRDTAYGNRFSACVRVLLGALLAYGGFFKLLDIESFGGVIRMYDMLPEAFAPHAAIVLPPLEVLLGIMLVVGYKTRAASLLSMILMGVFAVAIAVNAARGASFDCGCLELGRFGISENISMTLAARNIVLILAFLLVFNLRKNVLSIDARIERGTLRDI